MALQCQHVQGPQQHHTITKQIESPINWCHLGVVCWGVSGTEVLKELLDHLLSPIGIRSCLDYCFGMPTVILPCVACCLRIFFLFTGCGLAAWLDCCSLICASTSSCNAPGALSRTSSNPPPQIHLRHSSPSWTHLWQLLLLWNLWNLWNLHFLELLRPSAPSESFDWTFPSCVQ